MRCCGRCAGGCGSRGRSTPCSCSPRWWRSPRSCSSAGRGSLPARGRGARSRASGSRSASPSRSSSSSSCSRWRSGSRTRVVARAADRGLRTKDAFSTALEVPADVPPFGDKIREPRVRSRERRLREGRGGASLAAPPGRRRRGARAGDRGAGVHDEPARQGAGRGSGAPRGHRRRRRRARGDRRRARRATGVGRGPGAPRGAHAAARADERSRRGRGAVARGGRRARPGPRPGDARRTGRHAGSREQRGERTDAWHGSVGGRLGAVRAARRRARLDDA